MRCRPVALPAGRTAAITRIATWLVPAGGATPGCGTGPSARRPPPGRAVRACSSIATSTRATSCGRGRALTGIVDWVNACVGPAEVDTAHLRVNLAVLGDVANAERVVAGHPAWDIEAAFDFLDWGSRDAVETWPGPWPELDAATARIRLEAFVAQARRAAGLTADDRSASVVGWRTASTSSSAAARSSMAPAHPVASDRWSSRASGCGSSPRMTCHRRMSGGRSMPRGRSWRPASSISTATAAWSSWPTAGTNQRSDRASRPRSSGSTGTGSRRSRDGRTSRPS